MSLIIFESQGEYDRAKPILSSIKTSFAGFQWIEFASGEVATPVSPIAPALASGVILRKGTAVVITLVSSFCPTIFGGDVCPNNPKLIKCRARNVKRASILLFIERDKDN